MKLAHINLLIAGPHLTWLELLIRLGSALLLGGIIGAERQWRQRTAGLRTYSLVSIGAALFVLLATLTAEDRSDSQIEQITSRLSLERDVIGVSWQALPTTNAEQSLHRSQISKDL